jgi:hypothetical protein
MRLKARVSTTVVLFYSDPQRLCTLSADVRASPRCKEGVWGVALALSACPTPIYECAVRV